MKYIHLDETILLIYCMPFYNTNRALDSSSTACTIFRL